MIRVDITAIVRGVTVANAVAWWTDFREGRTDHGYATRRILERASDGAVTMEDRAPFFRERLTARWEGNVVRFEGVNTFSLFSGSYSFGRVADGTSVRLVATITLKSGWRSFEFVARPVARALLRADLNHHARELARDPGKRPSGGPS